MSKRRQKRKTNRKKTNRMTHAARAREKKEPFAHQDKRGRRSAARPDLNLTRLAEKVGVGPNYLSKLFRGIGTPSVPLMFRLAEELHVPPEELNRQLEAQREKRAGKGKGKGEGKGGRGKK